MIGIPDVGGLLKKLLTHTDTIQEDTGEMRGSLVRMETDIEAIRTDIAAMTATLDRLLAVAEEASAPAPVARRRAASR